MKNAKTYQRKFKKLQAAISRTRPPAPQVVDDQIGFVALAIMEADSPRKAATEALQRIRKHYVDYNEFRVSPLKDMAECMGKGFFHARLKAQRIVQAFNIIFERSYSMSIEYMQKMGKRDLRRHLREMGLDSYASALVAMKLFGAHAIPVDQSLVDCLEKEQYVAPGSSIDEVQGFLERVISQKKVDAAHEFFRQYVEKFGSFLAGRLAQRLEKEQEALLREMAARRKAATILPEREPSIEELAAEEQDEFPGEPAPNEPSRAAKLAVKLASAKKAVKANAAAVKKTVKAKPKAATPRRR